jgi:iron complex transport system substrate-binding protein
VTELIALAGGVNPLADEEVKSRPLTDDEVAALAPDAVVLSWCGVAPEKVRDDVVYGNPAWRELPFVRERRVFKIPEAFLGRPSPRLVDGLAALRRVVEAVRADATARLRPSPAGG